MKIIVTTAFTLGVTLVAIEASAQNLQWNPLGIGCATSIAVAPNNIPIITGCESGPDHNIYYLNTQPCQGHDCFGTTQTWTQMTGLQAASVSVDLNGQVYAVTSSGAVYIGACSNPNDTESCSGSWISLAPTTAQCIGALAPTEFSSFTEVNVTPPAYQTEDYLWGIGCSKNSAGNSDIYSWNINFTADEVFGFPQWDPSPGWTQRGTGAVQVAMFNYPKSDNAQVPWVISSPNTSTYNISSWNGTEFVSQPGALAYSITDHYVASLLLGIYRWNDETGAWDQYITFDAPESNGGTGLIQKIASSEGITLTSGQLVGPSQLWGVDSNGLIFYAAPVGVLPE